MNTFVCDNKFWVPQSVLLCYLLNNGVSGTPHPTGHIPTYAPVDEILPLPCLTKNPLIKFINNGASMTPHPTKLKYVIVGEVIPLLGDSPNRGDATQWQRGLPNCKFSVPSREFAINLIRQCYHIGVDYIFFIRVNRAHLVIN